MSWGPGDGACKIIKKLEQNYFKKVQRNVFKVPILYYKSRCKLYFIWVAEKPDFFFMKDRVKIILQSVFSWVYIENLIVLNKHKFDYPNSPFYELF